MKKMNIITILTILSVLATLYGVVIALGSGFLNPNGLSDFNRKIVHALFFSVVVLIVSLLATRGNSNKFKAFFAALPLIHVFAIMVISMVMKPPANSQVKQIEDQKTPNKEINSKSAPKVDSVLQESIMGAWATKGAENATFTIDEHTIFYPDDSSSYKYTLVEDNFNNTVIKIQYKDYQGEFFVKMPDANTLIFSEFEDQVFYRYKK